MESYSEMMTDIKKVKEQYKDGKNLSQRISIHHKYSVNNEGLGNWLFKQYNISEGHRILELGCGTGDLWNGKLKDLPDGVEIFITDFSKGMVNEAAEKYQDFDFIKTQIIDIQDIPFESEYFDIIIANFMLYHVPNIDKALSEVYRVLKPNGIFFAATVGDNHMVEINKWVFEFNLRVRFRRRRKCKPFYAMAWMTAHPVLII